MTWWGHRSRRNSAWRAVLVFALALTLAACRSGPRAVDDARASKAASLLPADLALEFLQTVKSEPSTQLLAGEAAIPPCRFSPSAIGSGGEYRKVTGQRGPTQLIGYPHWVLFKIEDASGRDFVPADRDRTGAWNYSLRTPRTARTVFGTTDRCIIGPTGEPVKKVVEALVALGVALAPEYGYFVR